MTKTDKRTSEQRVADALREVAISLEKAFDVGKRPSSIGLFDLLETLLTVADKLDPQ